MTTPTPCRAILWLAVSSEAQAADDKESLRAQRRDLEAVAEREGWRVIDVIEVPGHSRDYYTYQEFADGAAADGIIDPLRMFDHWERHDFDVFACRDSTRFGRKQSIFSEFVDRTLDAGARIYTLVDKWVEKSQRHMYISMAGYKAARDIDELVARHKMAMDANLEKGLPVSGRILGTHVRIRNHKGKTVALAIDENKRQLWNDLATLILEGVYWSRIHLELFNRFGHGLNGRPYSSGLFWRIVFAPMFWGHNARHLTGDYKKGPGLWRVEPGHEIPEGAKIAYNVIPAVYTGELAEKVKAELRRRETIGHGRGRTGKVMWWRGLFVCHNCGYAAETKTIRRGYCLLCTSNYTIFPHRSCPGPAYIPEPVAIEYVTTLLKRVIAEGPHFLTAPESPLPDLNGLRRELDRMEDRARKVVSQQLDYQGGELDKFYTEQLQTVSQDIAAQKRRIAEAEREISRVRQPDTRAVEELRRIKIEGFWELSGDQRNQLLHALLGDLRIVIDRHEIVGFRRKLAWR